MACRAAPLLALLPVLACQGKEGNVFVHGLYVLHERAERTDTVDLDLGAGGRLVVESEFGGVAVRAGDGAPRAVCRLVVNGPTKEDAEAALARFRVDAQRVAGGLVLRVAGEPVTLEREGMSVTLAAIGTFDVLAPKGTVLAVKGKTGNVTARGPLGGCELRVDHGAIDVAGVEGESVRVECATGNVKLADVAAKSVDVRAEHGKVELSGIAGNLSVRGSTGSVTLTGFRGGRCAIEAGHGRVDAEGVFEELEAELRTGNLSVRCGKGSRAAKPWRLETDHGRLELALPEGFACNLDARTDHGRIRSPFGGGEELEAAVGGGGERVALRTSTGNIEISGG